MPGKLPQNIIDEIDSLLSCWKRDRQKAMAFIESAQRPILVWLSLPKASKPATETRDRAQALKEAASSLRHVLEAAEREQEFMLSLQAEVRSRTATAIPGDVYDLLEGWQGLTAHHNVMSMPEWPLAFDVRDALDPLKGMLSLVADAAGGLEASIEPKPGRSVDHELQLIAQLVMRYREAFGKMPGKSSESPLMLFWEGLRPIIGTAASYREVIKQINKLEK